MSLEDAVSQNTVAVRELTLALLQMARMVGQPAAAPTIEQAALAAGAVVAAQTAVDTAAVVSFDDLKTAFMGLVRAKGADDARALLGELGLAKLSDAKPEAHPAVLAAIVEATA